jgi:nucleotide-binding universal stress UspA family protein
MSDKKIIFPTDFSTASDAALEYATRLANDMNAKLIIVHVEEPPLNYGGGELYYGMPEPDRPAIARMLERLTPTDPEVPFEHRLLTGSPATEIVKVATDEQVDLIVMGTHGRRGLVRLLMGSTAEAVVRRALCPVLTLRHAPHRPSKRKETAA